MGAWTIVRRFAAVSALLLGGTLLAAGSAQARTNYAVLVGVTKYPNVKGADLVGPKNDAVLVRDFLTGSASVPFLPENVVVLADEVEGAKASPTYQAIRAAMADVAARAEHGDFVYLHLSGHGIQQPAADVASEPDGLDEVFLPSDIKPWLDRSKGIPSAFPDDEIGAAVQAIRDKGAFVWIVIDACHSGTATRSLDGDVVERKIDPEKLGIPASAFKEAMAEAGGATRSIAPEESRALALYATQTTNLDDASKTGAESIVPGGMVAFFAAQTIETTPEMPLPAGDPDAKRLGLFTYTLFSKIAENPNQSYRQLGQSIMQAYAAGNRNRPTPLFEGDLDSPVFGTGGGEFIQQWPVKVTSSGMSVPAGKLHRLSQGTKLAILKSPASSLEDAIGYLEVQSSDNLTARVSPVAFGSKARMALADIPPGAIARLTEIAFDTELVVSRPAPNADYAAKISEVNAVLDEINSSSKTPVKLRLVEANQPADLKLAVLSEQDVALLVADAGANATTATVTAERNAISDEPLLWFLPSTAEVSLVEGRRPPSIAFNQGDPVQFDTALKTNLTSIFRATNLARLSAASNFGPEAFEVRFNVVRHDKDGAEPLQAGQMPLVHPLDQIHLVAHNNSGGPVDLNVLYVGSDYSISHMYAERLHDGSNVDEPLLEFNANSYGVERMIVVLSEANPNTPKEDLNFLEQAGVRAATRGLDYPDGFIGLLRDIGSAPATRGAMKLGKSAKAKGAVLIYPLENMPES